MVRIPSWIQIKILRFSVILYGFYFCSVDVLFLKLNSFRVHKKVKKDFVWYKRSFFVYILTHALQAGVFRTTGYVIQGRH
ncbi:hypothetical protein DWX08_01270 [Ruminococcus sp. AF18-22]|nr:hypothetical protein DWX08_01270 [Ruminococcus sp. AF18-22]